MDTKSAIEQLFDAVEKQSYVDDTLIQNAKTELSILKGRKLHPDASKTLEIIEEIVRDVRNNQKRSAQKKYTSRIKDDFVKLLKIHLQPSNKKNSHEAQYPTEPEPDYDQGHERGRPHDAQNNTYPDHRKVNMAEAEEYERHRSQKASQAMRHNNPEIADLSDKNRPTKIAERFIEFYDHEWTNAFEILSEKKKTEEKKITQLLLEIVEAAYSFCRKEAEDQIHAMNLALMNIMDDTKGKVQPDKDLPKDVSLLAQFRKEHAGRSIQRLQNTFDKDVKRICYNVTKEKPSNTGVMVKYGQKAVELTWWMCVQEPPVHMVSTKGQFSPEFYRAYTKSGKVPDFFVWPPLKLHEGGGILSKGVVQYK